MLLTSTTVARRATWVIRVHKKTSLGVFNHLISPSSLLSLSSSEKSNSSTRTLLQYCRVFNCLPVRQFINNVWWMIRSSYEYLVREAERRGTVLLVSKEPDFKKSCPAAQRHAGSGGRPKGAISQFHEDFAWSDYSEVTSRGVSEKGGRAQRRGARASVIAGGRPGRGGWSWEPITSAS